VTVRVGINGFGRIGRNFYRAVLASGADMEIVAANDLTDNATTAHLLKYDTILGRLEGDVTADATASPSTARRCASSPSGPGALPWKDLGVDVVVESTGLFTDATKAARTSRAVRRRSSSPRRPRTRTSPS
jgi:glyceraldehyde 3-phosphate dehydrogenase